MLSAVGRIIWVPIAFVVAATVAVTILVTLGMERVTQSMHGRAGDSDGLIALLELIQQASLLASGLTLVPALLVVIVGEVARIRSVLYYVLAGGASLAAMPLIARMGQAAMPGAAVSPVIVWQVFATAGFAGGLVYWLLAGRRA